ncbi:MAG: hypothetical protein ACREEJ_00775 [Ensifer adhaerens]
MEKATDDKRNDPPAARKKPRGPKLDLKRVSREEILHVHVPPGSRFKGYKSCHVRDLIVAAELEPVDGHRASTLRHSSWNAVFRQRKQTVRTQTHQSRRSPIGLRRSLCALY